MTVPLLLTIAQIAQLTHAPLGSVRSWIYSGRLASVKAGRRRLVAEAALLAFLGLDAEAENRKRPSLGGNADFATT